MRALIAAAVMAVTLAMAGPAAAQPAPGGQPPAVDDGGAPAVDPVPDDGDAGQPADAVEDGDPADEDPLTDVLEEGAEGSGGGGGLFGWDPLAALGEWVGRGAAWVMGKVIGFVDSTTAPDVEALWLNRLYAEMVAASMWLAALFVLGAVITSVLRGGMVGLGAVITRVFVVGIVLGIALRFAGLVLAAADDLSAGMLESASDGLGRLAAAISTILLATDGAGAPLIIVTVLGVGIVLFGLWIWLLMIFRTAAIYVLLVMLAWPAAMAVGGNQSSVRRYRSWLLGMIFLKPVVAAMLLIGSAPFAAGTGGVEDAGVTAAAIGLGVLASTAIAPWFLARFFDSTVVAPAAAMFSSIMPRRGMGGRGPIGASKQVGRMRERFLTRSQATRTASSTTARATRGAGAAAAGAGAGALAAGAVAAPAKVLTRPLRAMGAAADRVADADRVMAVDSAGGVQVTSVGTRLPITTTAVDAEPAGRMRPRVHDDPVDVEVVPTPRAAARVPAGEVAAGAPDVRRVGETPALPTGRISRPGPTLTGDAGAVPRAPRPGPRPVGDPAVDPRAPRPVGDPAVDPRATTPLSEPQRPAPPPRRDAPPQESQRITGPSRARTPGRGRVVRDDQPLERPEPPPAPRRDPRRVEPPADRPRRNDR